MRELYIHDANSAEHTYHESYAKEVWEYYALTMDSSDGEVDHMKFFYATYASMEPGVWTPTTGAHD
jgi:hypothetical protein